MLSCTYCNTLSTTNVNKSHIRHADVPRDDVKFEPRSALLSETCKARR